MMRSYSFLGTVLSGQSGPGGVVFGHLNGKMRYPLLRVVGELEEFAWICSNMASMFDIGNGKNHSFIFTLGHDLALVSSIADKHC